MPIWTNIKTKLRSQQGASLSMALFLLLVCTIIASVTLTAGSAAVGRLSQIEGIQKSYYNVTSAAKVLADKLKDEVEVEVVRGCTGNKNSDAWTLDGNTWSLTIDGKESSYSKTNSSLFELLTCDLVFGTDNEDLGATRSINKAAIGNSINASIAVPEPKDVTFTSFAYKPFEVTVSATDASFDKVNVTVTRNEDQTFSFKFTEQETANNPSPSVYTVVASVVVNPPNSPYEKSEHQLEWANKVTWHHVETIAGDA